MSDVTTLTAPMGKLRPKRLLVLAIMLVLAVAPGQLGELTRELMTDAYVQVSVFVAATLLLFYGAERLFNFDIGESLSKARGAQVPLAALLGTTPGCGGAVVVVAAYSSGHVGFGAVVATLTATMGDAAFLLIATRPDAALVVLPLSLVVGILSGWLVDRFHKVEYRASNLASCELAPLIGRTRPQDVAYLLIAIPGFIVGVAQLGQVEINSIVSVPVQWLALIGTFLGLTIWATSQLAAMTNASDSPLTRMAEETSFISVWVIGAYLAYDYVAEFAGLDIELLFQSIAPLLPLMAVLVGLIPGCGPQVLVATLFLNGVIPFAALMGNAISNDGDALFPAIALNPKAAVMATLYSTIPALIVAYAFFFLAPNFMN
ncbi:putative manganese transporter [Aliiroseovarius sp. F47248L]|uniref:putative manganese transporter n=1 Tax=Aliiroseovarius sp. F47248L TaxID=2926420 RepID=UPI001FF41F1B|nr:putative manganese transporter [Aliiroseovarius sp. F47248L]MCK0137967.1 putative manganese transporter [Aliiroseovarius sp. F47248L]